LKAILKPDNSLKQHTTNVLTVRYTLLKNTPVKLKGRLLLTLPFATVTFLYLKFQWADNGCWGLVELAYTIILCTLLALSFALALYAVLGKRQSGKFSAEPYSLTIAFITLCSLIIGLSLGDTLKGAIWIRATRQKHNSNPTTQDLILRKNGTFETWLSEADFSCFASGQYQTKTDTIILEDKVVKMAQFKLTSKYLLLEKSLVPVTDSTKDERLLLPFEIVNKR